MFDYSIFYHGSVIANLKADTDRKALNLARKIYGPNVSVTKG